jgi:hypothetical protein
MKLKRCARRWESLALLAVALGAWAAGAGRTLAQPSGLGTALLVNEELVYNVRWAFFDLGQIKIQTLRKVQTPRYSAHEVLALIQSYSSIPFVHVRATFVSTIDSAIFSHLFLSHSKEDDWVDYSRYTYDYTRGCVVMESGRNDTVISKRDTVGLDGPCQDGLSLFFFARENLFSKKSFNVPVIVKEQKVNATINFTGERDAVEVDAIDYPVDVLHFDGNLDFVGFFGLTGAFEGWFSNDTARIPITAKLKVILGSVTVELLSWKREGWTPPRARS